MPCTQTWRLEIPENKISDFFCTENGILIKSCEDALKLTKTGHQELTELFLSTFNIKTSKDEGRDTKTSKFNWKEDSTPPAGWKGRSKQGKIAVLLDPQGNRFKTRRAVLHHCIKNTESSELIKKIQSCLVHEEWKENIELPAGWMYKNKKKTFFFQERELLPK